MAKAFHDPSKDWVESNIKSHWWANWCKVYIKGELGKLEGVILQDWDIVESLPDYAELLGYGMDFGYTNDPSTWIACYRSDNRLIWDEVIYRKGLKTNDMANMMKDLGDPYKWTYADQSDPRVIDELDSYGIRVVGAKKGTGSINFGIDLLQQEPFSITSRSVNLIKEAREY